MYQEREAGHERHLGGRGAGSGRAVSGKLGQIPRKTLQEIDKEMFQEIDVVFIDDSWQ